MKQKKVPNSKKSAKSKILIISAGGQLAFDLERVFKKNYQVFGLTHRQCDVTQTNQVLDSIKKTKPSFVINTAAFHQVEQCEVNYEKSFRVNAIGAYNVAYAAALFKSKVIFISTDYVFDGTKIKFNEQDRPNPLNIYGASKQTGEILTKIANQNFYIIRTSGLFGIHPSGKGYNFVTLMLRKAEKGEVIEVVNDIFFSPTYTYDLAIKIKELVETQAPSGIYHMANSGFCSWYQFACQIFKLANIKTKVTAVDWKKFAAKIKRPKYSVLISKNLKKAGLSSLRPWPEALADYLREIKKI